MALANGGLADILPGDLVHRVVALPGAVAVVAFVDPEDTELLLLPETAGFHHALLAVELEVPAISIVAADLAVEALDHRAVVQGHHLDARAEPDAHGLQAVVQPGAFIACDLHGTAAGGCDNGAKGVGAVEGGVHEIAPVVGVAVGDLGPDGGAVVEVFALGVGHIAQTAFLVKLPHFEGPGHIAAVFRIGVHFTGALHSLHQGHGLGHGLAGQALGQHMQTSVQAADGEGRMLGGIVCQNHRVHIMANKILKAFVERRVHAGGFRLLLHLLQGGNILVADGYQFCFRISQQHLDHGHATVGTEYADSRFHKKLLSVSGLTSVGGCFKMIITKAAVSVFAFLGAYCIK